MGGAGNQRGIILPSTIQDDQRGMGGIICRDNIYMFGMAVRYKMQAPVSGA
jgi:hypothetical protein